MIGINRIFDFLDDRRSVNKIHVGDISGFIITKNDFIMVCIRNFLQPRRICQNADRFRCNFSFWIHPNGIGDFPEGKTETDIVCPGWRSYCINIGSIFYRYSRSRAAETTAFQYTFSNISTIRSTRKIRHDRITERTLPIVHPFHGISSKITESNILDGLINCGTGLMQLKIRIFSIPVTLRIPILQSGQSPFSLGRKPIGIDFCMECVTDEIRTMSFGVKDFFCISVSSI